MAEEEPQAQVSTIEEHVEEHAEDHAGSTDETVAPDIQGDEDAEHTTAEPVGLTSDDVHANGASEEPVDGENTAEQPAGPEADVSAEPAATSPQGSPKKAVAPTSPVKFKAVGRPSVTTKPIASKAVSTPTTPIVKKVRAVRIQYWV